MSKRLNLSRSMMIAGIVLGTPWIGGCAAGAAVSAVASMASSAMEMTGLKKPENGPTDVKLSIEAGENLNISNGQAMAAVTKIYYLKTSDAFQQAPLTDLIDPQQEKTALGDSLLSEREITLTPGEVYRNVEKVPKEAVAIGVATLFYAPAPRRWKYVFDIKDAKDTGIVMGAHACALTVVTGKVSLPSGTPPFDASRLGSLHCTG